MKLIKTKDFYFLLTIALIKILSWFPSLTVKTLTVNSVAFAAYLFSRNKRRLAEQNILEVFDGKLSRNQRRSIIKGAFWEFWQEIFSLFPSSRERAILQVADVQGIEHLHSALKKGRGVILWESRFFGQRILAKQILHKMGFSLYQVHGENHLGGFINDGSSVTWIRHHVISPFFERCEKQFVAGIIYLPTSDSLAFTRILLSRLQQNAIICITGDGKFGQKLIPLKFLNHTTSFPTGMVSLARISSATILAMFCIRKKKDQIRLIIEPSIDIEPNIDREHYCENAINHYVKLLEFYIRRYPTLYRNWHSSD